MAESTSPPGTWNWGSKSYIYPFQIFTSRGFDPQPVQRCVEECGRSNSVYIFLRYYPCSAHVSSNFIAGHCNVVRQHKSSMSLIGVLRSFFLQMAFPNKALRICFEIFIRQLTVYVQAFIGASSLYARFVRYRQKQNLFSFVKVNLLVTFLISSKFPCTVRWSPDFPKSRIFEAPDNNFTSDSVSYINQRQQQL